MQIVEGLRHIDNVVGRIICEDNVPIPLPLPKKFYNAQILIRLYGKITIATAAATAKPDLSPFSLIKLIRVSAGGKQVIKSYTGQDLSIINTIKHSTPSPKTEPGLTIATHEFEGLLLIDFAELKAKVPIDTLFNSAGLEVYFIEITWGDKEDIVTPDATTVLSWDVTPYVDIAVIENFGKLDVPRILNMEYTSEHEVTADYDQFPIKINPGNFYRFLTLISRDAGVRENDIIETITLKSSSEIFVNRMPARVIQLKNKQDYGLESILAGVYVIDLAKFGSNKDLLDARRLSELQFELKTKKGTGTTKIRAIMQEYIMPVGPTI